LPLRFRRQSVSCWRGWLRSLVVQLYCLYCFELYMYTRERSFWTSRALSITQHSGQSLLRYATSPVLHIWWTSLTASNRSVVFQINQTVNEVHISRGCPRGNAIAIAQLLLFDASIEAHKQNFSDWAINASWFPGSVVQMSGWECKVPHWGRSSHK
jgi:hypothetical protein